MWGLTLFTISVDGQVIWLLGQFSRLNENCHQLHPFEATKLYFWLSYTHLYSNPKIYLKKKNVWPKSIWEMHRFSTPLRSTKSSRMTPLWCPGLRWFEKIPRYPVTIGCYNDLNGYSRQGRLGFARIGFIQTSLLEIYYLHPSAICS